jgi:hypothetical protein
MQLKVGKSYRARNGATVEIYALAANGTAHGKECLIGPSIAYHSYNGSTTDRTRAGFDIVSFTPIGEPSELMFSFPLPDPEYSKTVSETELKRMIDEVQLCDFRKMSHVEALVLAAAAERMIEQAKAKPEKLKLNPAISIRSQIAHMLREIGLEPDRFLTKPPSDASSVYYTKEPNAVCMNGTYTDDKKAAATGAAATLSQIMKDDLGISINPIILRLWLIERWDKVAELAHKIHDAK